MSTKVGTFQFRRAVLAPLLVTQIFLFWLDQRAVLAGTAVDLLVPGAVAAELNAMADGGSPGTDRSSAWVR